MSLASEICKKATELVEGDREAQHGEKKENLGNIAKLLSAYLDIPITAEQVAWIGVLTKCARTKTGEFNIDDFVDAAGYAGCAAEVSRRGEKPAVETPWVGATVYSELFQNLDWEARAKARSRR